VIDTATNTVVTRVPLGVTNTISPIELAVAPDGKHVYVLPGFKVLVIDAATNIVVAIIPVEETTFGLAVTPDSKHVYACSKGPALSW
jgi:YVTN family beta-propeller protein